jgi:sugar lactone lactonase YvrE
MQPRVRLDGLAVPESPRWHDGGLWFSDWGTSQIVAVDLDGNGGVVGEGPAGLGGATNWATARTVAHHGLGADPR